jgi:hypothetical protein
LTACCQALSRRRPFGVLVERECAHNGGAMSDGGVKLYRAAVQFDE